MELSAGDVSQVTFSTAPFGMRGYDMSEVDAYLDLIESAIADGIAGRRPSLSAADVRAVTFSPGSRLRRGYSAEEVDRFLALVEAELERWHRHAVGGGQTPGAPASAAQDTSAAIQQPGPWEPPTPRSTPREPQSTPREPQLAPPLEEQQKRRWWQRG